MQFLEPFLLIALIIGLAFVAVDRHLILKAVEIDLKEMLGDMLVARDASDAHVRVHYHATASLLKALIKKHFKL